jgi:hypothetical protein
MLAAVALGAGAVPAAAAPSATCAASGPGGTPDPNRPITIVQGEQLTFLLGTRNTSTSSVLSSVEFVFALRSTVMLGPERHIFRERRAGGGGLTSGATRPVGISTAYRPDGSGRVRVDVFTPGTPGLAAVPCDFHLTVLPNRALYPDSDKDGLLDRWETLGYDADGDGTVDVDLPAMGASPGRKDIFVELDWVPGAEPTPEQIEVVRQAFHTAPWYAGGSANPDGRPGIALHVDTGGLRGPDGRLVGDNFGGGNPVAQCDDFCRVRLESLNDEDFALIKRTGLLRGRHGLFHYAISAPEDHRIDPNLGGQAEKPGDDLILYDTRPALFMHELGHNLGLDHGGHEVRNCKPNYLSVMNYLYSGAGVQRVGLGFRVDFYPPLRPDGTRVRAARPSVESSLDEAQLDETAILDPGDATFRLRFSDPSQTARSWPIGQAVDWNANGTIGETGLAQDIDVFPNLKACAAAANGGHATLRTTDDWARIRLPFRMSNGGANDVSSAQADLVPTRAQARALDQLFAVPVTIVRPPRPSWIDILRQAPRLPSPVPQPAPPPTVPPIR